MKLLVLALLSLTSIEGYARCEETGDHITCIEGRSIVKKYKPADLPYHWDYHEGEGSPNSGSARIYNYGPGRTKTARVGKNRFVMYGPYLSKPNWSGTIFATIQYQLSNKYTPRIVGGPRAGGCYSPVHSDQRLFRFDLIGNGMNRSERYLMGSDLVNSGHNRRHNYFYKRTPTPGRSLIVLTARGSNVSNLEVRAKNVFGKYCGRLTIEHVEIRFVPD